MPARPRVDWNRIRAELFKGRSVKAVSEQYGVTEQTIRNKGSKEKWELRKGKSEILRRVGEGEPVQEIEVAIEQLGVRMAGASLRSKVLMAEAAEGVLKRLREAEGINELTRSRCLVAMAQVCEKVHRWSSEPSSEELERMKSGAVNLRLIRTSPEELRRRARAAQAAKVVEVEVRAEGAGG
jgi:hypothetical protein